MEKVLALESDTLVTIVKVTGAFEAKPISTYTENRKTNSLGYNLFKLNV